MDLNFECDCVNSIGYMCDSKTMIPVKASFDYSLKSIPIPSRDTHLRGMIDKTEQFLQRVRWKVHFFENPPNTSVRLETYGFKTTKNAPQSKSLINFENDMTHLIANLEYSNHRTNFQKRLLSDVKKIHNSKDLYVFADKTTNVYRMDVDSYNKLMRDSVTTHYEKTDESTEQAINQEAKLITEKLKISDRVEPTAKKNAYITIKDHKENFPNNIKCRLINPAKSNIGKISQKILKNINFQIRNELKLQQWCSTRDALNWFKNLTNKTRLKFIQLDIVDFYPSITMELANAAIDFASTVVNISSETKSILHNARQSILFHNNSVWKKTTGLFDVTMGSLDGCELCELVGLHILHQVRQKFPEIDFGLYRDDGLGALKRTPKTKLEKLKKELHKYFKDNLGLSITLTTDLTVVNFLDVTLDLHGERFYPYRKPNDVPTYVNKDSNHPAHIARNLPEAISRRLSELSSDRAAFDDSKGEYEKALRESGMACKLTFNPTKNNGTNSTRRRRRKIIWFNPPYSASLKTNIGREFLKLIDKNFTVNNPLHKILNRKTIKLSYSCTSNMKNIIKGHNQKIIASQKAMTDTPECNCRDKETCPVPGECCRSTVVYRATVEHDNRKAEYVGSTEGPFKLRYNNHKKSFRHEAYQSETTLSKYIWANGLNPTPEIKWEFIRTCKPIMPGHRNCDLCLSEKMNILKNLQNPRLINKRTDIGNRCPHRKKCMLGT